MSSSSRDSQIYYDTRMEIFIALKDVHSSYTLSSSGDLKSSPNIRSQQVIVYWKPPGALQWLVKFKSEILPGKTNLQFVSSLILDFESKDISSIGLKFEIRHLVARKSLTPTASPDADRKEGMSLWSVTHITLDKLIAAGCKGLAMFLPLDFGVPETRGLSKQCRKVEPGKLFLRAELVQPSPFGVLLQFGIQSEKSASDYYIELHKLNQDNAFELSHPYTLVYRSELDEFLPNYPTQNGKKIYFLEAKLANGDLDRVLKIDIFKKETFERKGFALTTLGTLLRDQSQVLGVDRVDSFYPYRKKEMKIILNLYAKIPIQPIEYFFRQGWKIVPVFAVDFSRSNWNEELHKRVLHDSNIGRTPYEEALELASDTISIIAGGHAVFYGFGCPSNAYMNAYRTGSQQVNSALQNYQDALCMSLMSSMSISQERSPVDGASSSQSSSSSASVSLSPLVLTGGSLLSPLFNDLVALITARKESLEYYSVIILTDGQFTDNARYIGLLRELSILPVSIILIGIGLGDFRLLLELEQAWTMSLDGMFLPRKFVHLIHFRCQNHWESSLAYDKFRSNPREIFAKEILTTVQDHALDYFRRYFNESTK